MHILALVIYGLTIWFSAMAYAAITNNGWLGTVAMSGPFIISGAVAFIAAIDLVVWKLTRTWTALREKPRARH